jgi:predicted phosphate transport protein (TIGR00153 family)
VKREQEAIVPRFSLRPRDTRFFDLFEQDSVNLVEAGKALVSMLEDWRDVEVKANAITDIEHTGDSITHEIISHLHRTFVTPMDREDMTALVNALDDVLDFIQAATDDMILYKVPGPTPRARELGRIILEATLVIQRALPILRNQSKLNEILVHCVELNRLENQADRVYRAALGELFRESTDVIMLLKWREIYEHLESATDRCEDVANVLEGVALKYA